MMRYISFSLAFLFFLVAPVFAGTYEVDPSSSKISFTAKHFVIMETPGTFNDFKGTFELDDNGQLISAESVIKVMSVQTGRAERNNNVSGDWLMDAEKHPDIIFKSKRISGSNDRYTVVGDITIKGVTKQIVLTGRMKSNSGGRASFHAEGKLNRNDFGIFKFPVYATTGLLMAAIVEIELDITGIKK